MTAIAELNIPQCPPDISDLAITQGYTANLWLPTPEQSGTLVTSEWGSSRWNDSSYLTDMRYASPVMRRSSRMRALYNYLGVDYDHYADSGTITQSVSFADPNAVNDRLLALDLPTEHRPPLATPWAGGDYPAEEAAEELVRSGRFLVATEGRQIVHDMVVHFALGQVLMRPNDIDRLASQAKRALWETSSTEIFMDKLDVLLSAVSIGKYVAKAFAYEQQLEEDRDPESRQALSAAMQRSWLRAGDAYACLVNMSASASLLHDFREHCLMLSTAVHQQVVKESSV